MRTVIQRVNFATVKIDGFENASIKKGLLIFIGIENDDNDEDVNWLSSKVCNLRIFDDENGVMNLSVKEIDGEILSISQFTLHAKTKKGNRPSYIHAAKPEIAIPIYEKFNKQLEFEIRKEIKTGIFGADMKISLENDGPVTIIIDTKNKE
ncbi:MAG: D-tyrosyl-tRNA(Tyr) deacylase [Bacteroidales bacterium]|nr:D-tyrosyl-tRNA(Tyr) deacylase [Bacteroidales bacterium]MBN2756759.1 D-tyrosyl-tRNA(Tyr) deacylase [Bacteroidales bacterium]